MAITYALGVVRHVPGTPKMDRDWARALVVRHAHEQRWQLVDILELTDLDAAVDELARQLHHGARGLQPSPSVLVTQGVPSAQGETLAAQHQMVLAPVSPI